MARLQQIASCKSPFLRSNHQAFIAPRISQDYTKQQTYKTQSSIGNKYVKSKLYNEQTSKYITIDTMSNSLTALIKLSRDLLTLLT